MALPSLLAALPSGEKFNTRHFSVLLYFEGFDRREAEELFSTVVPAISIMPLQRHSVLLIYRQFMRSCYTSVDFLSA